MGFRPLATLNAYHPTRSISSPAIRELALAGSGTAELGTNVAVRLYRPELPGSLAANTLAYTVIGAVRSSDCVPALLSGVIEELASVSANCNEANAVWNCRSVSVTDSSPAPGTLR